MSLSRRALLAGSAALSAMAALPRGAGAQALTKVQFGDVSRTATNWPLQIADTSGFFEREKLAVEATYVGNNPAVAQQVVGGSFDMGLTTVETAIRAVELGAPITMIASVMLKFPYAFMAAPTISTAADLKGKKVILDLPKGFLAFQFGKWLRANKMDISDVEVVYDGSSTNRLAALVAGVVVLAPVTQPLDFMAIDRGYKKLIDSAGFAKNFGFSAVIAKTSWLEQNANTAKAFLRAGSAATDFFYVRKNRDAAVTTLANSSKVEPAIVGKVYDYYTSTLQPYQRHLDLPEIYVKTVIDYLVDAGELKSAGPPSKYMDRRFLDVRR